MCITTTSRGRKWEWTALFSELLAFQLPYPVMEYRRNNSFFLLVLVMFAEVATMGGDSLRCPWDTVVPSCWRVSLLPLIHLLLRPLHPMLLLLQGFTSVVGFYTLFLIIIRRMCWNIFWCLSLLLFFSLINWHCFRLILVNCWEIKPRRELYILTMDFMLWEWFKINCFGPLR